jgi:hypothetical protein|tara:strand:+ start:274 stop:504 length:231 start_codon:yes stop_codon:yes gene_type:complete
MLILFDFKCEDGHVDEHFVTSDTTEVTCKECGKIATRLVSAPRVSLEPFSGDFAGATMKWVRDREKKLQKERKANS